MTATRKLNILITGCSMDGMGAALALAFHKAGHRVFATARNPSKMAPLAKQGLQTLPLDISSAESIASAVKTVSASLPDGAGLDMLVNNAAMLYTMTLADVSLDAARNVFEVNVWSQIAVTQAFMPLILKSADAGRQPIIVNHTSLGSVGAIPFQGIYNASKAAMAMLSDTQRFELAPFGIRVVELKTGGVKTNIIATSNANGDPLPADTIYAPARDIVERAMRHEGIVETVKLVPVEQWAAEVSVALLARNPSNIIWKGANAWMGRVATILPVSLFEGFIKKMTKLDVVEEIVRENRRARV